MDQSAVFCRRERAELLPGLGLDVETGSSLQPVGTVSVSTWMSDHSQGNFSSVVKEEEEVEALQLWTCFNLASPTQTSIAALWKLPPDVSARPEKLKKKKKNSLKEKNTVAVA